VSSEEPHVIAALIEVCRQSDVKALVQIGAEDGYEADCIRNALGCRAVCIEPDPKCGPCSSLLEWHEVLIGENNDVTNFYINATSGLSSKVHRADSLEILAVMPQVRLDKFCRTHRIKPDALIIDVEGCTMDVLAGAGSLLDFVKVIYAEVTHDDSRGTRGMATDVDALLTGLGFRRSMELPTYSCGGQSNWTFLR
jgi:FkbM family methyltransferase